MLDYQDIREPRRRRGEDRPESDTRYAGLGLCAPPSQEINLVLVGDRSSNHSQGGSRTMCRKTAWMTKYRDSDPVSLADVSHIEELEIILI